MITFDHLQDLLIFKQNLLTPSFILPIDDPMYGWLPPDIIDGVRLHLKWLFMN